MKKHLITALTVLALTSTAAFAQFKIAVVDMQKVFGDYYKTKDAETELKDNMASIRKEEQEMRGDYQKMVDETSKLREAAQDKTLSEQMRTEKEEAFKTKVTDLRNMERKIQEFRSTRTQQFEERSRRLRGSIVEEITKTLQDYAAKEKYNMVFDKSGLSMNATPVLLYSQDVKDLTDDIVKMINANKPAAGAAAPKDPKTAAPAPAAPPKKTN